jgi:hypothetical protein
VPCALAHYLRLTQFEQFGIPAIHPAVSGQQAERSYTDAIILIYCYTLKVTAPRRSICENISPGAVTESIIEPVKDSAAAAFLTAAGRHKYSIFPENPRRFSRSEK